MTDEADLNENVAILDLAKAQLEGLARQQELIRLAIEEHMRAKETLKRLSRANPGEELLVPIGADSYIHAKVSDNRYAVVGVGGDVSIRRSPEETEKMMDTKVSELNDALNKVANRASETEAAIQQLSAKIQEQYDRLKSEGKA